PRLLPELPPFREVRGAHRVRHAVVLAVEVLELERRLVDVALAERADQLVHRSEQVLHVERRGHERVQVREIGRAPGRERREQLCVEIAPAERLLLHLEAGELLLELRNARVLDRLHGLRLDLGVPDVQLAHLLAERRGGLREDGGADRDRRSGEEVTAGARVSHSSTPFRWAALPWERTCDAECITGASPPCSAAIASARGSGPKRPLTSLQPPMQRERCREPQAPSPALPRSGIGGEEEVSILGDASSECCPARVEHGYSMT